jgi:hypothetical protein
MRFLFLPIILIVFGCGQAKSSADQNSKVSTIEDTSTFIETDVNSKEAEKVDSLSLLLDDLKEFTRDDDTWKVVGGLKTAELRYKDVYFGDLYHLIFIGDDKKEYDFNGNNTNIDFPLLFEVFLVVSPSFAAFHPMQSTFLYPVVLFYYAL